MKRRLKVRCFPLLFSSNPLLDSAAMSYHPGIINVLFPFQCRLYSQLHLDTEYVNKYATKDAADEAGDEDESEDEMSSVGSFGSGDEDVAGQMEV